MLALGMLAAVLAVVMGLRTQAMRGERRAAAVLASERATDALFQMVINRTLLEFEIDPETRRSVWTGTHLGRPYRIERDVVVVGNPVLGMVPQETAEEVAVFEYTIEYDGRTTKAVWHR